MTANDLVYHVCPGADLLGRGFTAAGYCVVLGGDPMFGQQGIETAHPPPGAFEGVIGGPPCQMWAQSHDLSGDKDKQVNLIPEFERIVREAQPAWFLMENVTGAPVPQVEGYHIVDHKIYAWELGNPQRRYRRFTFGSKPPVHLLWPHGERPPRGALTLVAKTSGGQDLMPRQRDALPTIVLEDGHAQNIYSLTGSPRVHSNRNGRVYPTLTETNSTQRMRAGERAVRGLGIPGKTTFSLDDYRLGFGLAADWDAPALLKAYRFKVLGNGVPYQVSLALAQAIRYATRAPHG